MTNSKYFWMSFVHTAECHFDVKQDTFAGVVITEACSLLNAFFKASLLGLNPGGEMAGYECEEPPSHLLDRLLTKEESLQAAKIIKHIEEYPND